MNNSYRQPGKAIYVLLFSCVFSLFSLLNNTYNFRCILKIIMKIILAVSNFNFLKKRKEKEKSAICMLCHVPNQDCVWTKDVGMFWIKRFVYPSTQQQQPARGRHKSKDATWHAMTTVFRIFPYTFAHNRVEIVWIFVDERCILLCVCVSIRVDCAPGMRVLNLVYCVFGVWRLTRVSHVCVCLNALWQNVKRIFMETNKRWINRIAAMTRITMRHYFLSSAMEKFFSLNMTE